VSDKYACLSLHRVPAEVQVGPHDTCDNKSGCFEVNREKRKRRAEERVTNDYGTSTLKAFYFESKHSKTTFDSPWDCRMAFCRGARERESHPTSPATVRARGPLRNGVTQWNGAPWHKKTVTRRKGQRIYSAVMVMFRHITDNFGR